MGIERGKLTNGSEQVNLDVRSIGRAQSLLYKELSFGQYVFKPKSRKKVGSVDENAVSL